MVATRKPVERSHQAAAYNPDVQAASARSLWPDRGRRDQPCGTIEPVHNPVTLVEIAVEKGATAILMPVTCRKLLDPSDEMAIKVDIQFYLDARDALLRSLGVGSRMIGSPIEVTLC